uniref:SDR family NAD(P)-dependent oxidoreductase n=1 Tax=Polynucleobacter sp. TaxID=2029855 RepID=UPI00404870E6
MSDHQLFENFSLHGKLILVTGASSGLGRHFAQILSQAGAKVVLAARRVDLLSAIVADIEKSGGTAWPIKLDVTDSGSVKQCFDQMAQFGDIDVVVNNAGVTVTKSLLDQSEKDFDDVLDTNLKGCWLVASEVARRMKEANRPGNIINIASILGERVAGGVAPYAISKAAVIQATKSMALELARYNIRVNALMPGYVITELNQEFLKSEAGDKLRMRIPSRQFCSLEDLSGPMLLLASNASQGMSGSCITVDRAHLVSSL